MWNLISDLIAKGQPGPTTIVAATSATTECGWALIGIECSVR